MREFTEDDCACLGGRTLPIEDMEECLVCERSVRWDLVEHPLFGFGSKPCAEALKMKARAERK